MGSVALIASAIASSAGAQTMTSVGALRNWDGTEEPPRQPSTPRAQPTPVLRTWGDPAPQSSATASAGSGANAAQSAPTNSRSGTNAPANASTSADETAGNAQRRARGARPNGANTTQSANGAPQARDASGAIVLPALRVGRAHARGSEAASEEEPDEQPIVIEMFDAPGVTPFPAPFALRPFGPPHRPLRLISSYDGHDDESQPRVTVTIVPTLTIMREYDGEPPQPPEVRIEVVAVPDANALILLPMRVLSRIHP